jgi:predicted Zn-ribbon and HTH transcriptional regulator
MAQSHRCPKCQSAMVEGFVIDNTYGTRAVSTWLEGAPAKSIWVGVKLEGRKPMEIETWRCSKCGFLESYAPPA